MAKGLVIVSLLCLLVSFAQVTAQECRQGWEYFNGFCYGYSDTLASWTEAASVCTLVDAYLAEVESDEENDFLGGLIANKTARTTKVWLGGTDIFEEGNWVWVSKRSHIYPYSKWHSSQPSDSNSAGEDCLAIYSDHFDWYDEACPKEYNFICEQKYVGEGEDIFDM